MAPVSCVTPSPELAHRPHLVSPGGIWDEQVVTDEFFQGACHLFVGVIFKRVAEVLAIDLFVSQEGAEAGVEHAGVGGEGKRPDLGLISELPDPGCVLRPLATRIPQLDNLGEVTLSPHR